MTNQNHWKVRITNIHIAAVQFPKAFGANDKYGTISESWTLATIELQAQRIWGTKITIDRLEGARIAV